MYYLHASFVHISMIIITYSMVPENYVVQATSVISSKLYTK